MNPLKDTTTPRVGDVMTRGVRTLSPDASLVAVAQAMATLDVGAIPICDGARLLGLVTDRDRVLRGLAQGRAAQHCRMREVMMPDPEWCCEDDALDEAVERMQSLKLRRLPVVDHQRRLVGMLSLGDVTQKAGESCAAVALGQISVPARPDRAGTSGATGDVGVEYR